MSLTLKWCFLTYGCMSLSVCTCICRYPWRPEVVRLSESGVMSCCEPSPYWEQNSGSLEKQQALLSTEPSSRPWKWYCELNTDSVCSYNMWASGPWQRAGGIACTLGNVKHRCIVWTGEPDRELGGGKILTQCRLGTEHCFCCFCKVGPSNGNIILCVATERFPATYAFLVLGFH